MFLNSVVSEGLAGMQQSHKKMQQAAEQIVKAGLPTDNSVQNIGATGSAPVTNNGSAVNDLPSSSSIEAVTGSDGLNAPPSYRQSGDVIEPLLELKQQELMFDASASVVKTGNEMLGQLIDDIS